MKKIILIITAAIPLGLSAQKIDTAYNATSYSRIVVGSNFKGVVFAANYRPENTTAILKNRFTPTDDEILRAEKILQNYLRNRRNKRAEYKEVHDILPESLRQYTGFLDKNGNKIITVRGIPKDMFEKGTTLPGIHENDWYTHYIIFFDGGCSLWYMNINLDKNIIGGPICNGVA